MMKNKIITYDKYREIMTCDGFKKEIMTYDEYKKTVTPMSFSIAETNVISLYYGYLRICGIKPDDEMNNFFHNLKYLVYKGSCMYNTEIAENPGKYINEFINQHNAITKTKTKFSFDSWSYWIGFFIGGIFSTILAACFLFYK